MPIVSAINLQIKNPNRYNLFIGGIFYCGIDEAVCFKYKLKVGLELGQIELEQILQESEVNKVYARVLDYIARRPRSVREARDYIIKKIRSYKLSVLDEGGDAVQQVVDSIMQRLVRLKYVDDREFTKWWIDQRVNSVKPKSIMVITSELSRKGISAELVKRVWTSMGINSTEILSSYYQKVAHKYNLENKRDRNRFVRHLLGRGFRWEEIKSVLQLPSK